LGLGIHNGTFIMYTSRKNIVSLLYGTYAPHPP
jgi:hypothetical protein